MWLKTSGVIILGRLDARFGKVFARCRQQGHRRPAGGRDSLGVADIAGRTGCFSPASVVVLLGDQEPAALCHHRFDFCSFDAFRESQKDERGVEGLGR